jgi:hypothetical protein
VERLEEQEQAEQEQAEQEQAEQELEESVGVSDLLAEVSELIANPEEDEPEIEDDSDAYERPAHAEVRGVSAPASTTLTDGVYDEIRRLRSRVREK